MRKSSKTIERVDSAFGNQLISAVTIVANQDKRVARDEAAAGMHHQANEYGQGWYWHARRLLQWGEVQHSKHAQWEDLFYDLILVAFAFQIGNFLKQNLTYVEGPLGLLAMGLTTVQSWMLVLSYRARFEAASPVHRMLDAVEGLLFAAAQHNIVADLESFKDVHMYVFLAITIALRVIAIVRRLELAAVYEHERFGSVRSTCVKESAGLLFEVFVLACGFAASTAITLFEALLAGWVVHVISLQGPTFMKFVPRHSDVASHVEFSMSRSGELIMLMLGEGVLSLIISPASTQGYCSPEKRGDTCYFCASKCRLQVLKHVVSFAAAFLMVTSLMYLYFRANPTGHGVRYHHAAWRSVRRGIVWTVSHPFLSIELIGVGVAIKTIQPYATKALPLKYALLLCTATSATILNIDFQQLMHPGLEAFFMAPGRLQRCGLWLLKLLIALSMLLCLLFPKGTEGWVYLLYTCVLSFVTAMCVIAEKSPKIEAAVWGYIEEREKAHALRDAPPEQKA